jgi:ubiquinone/menaquinone biosynthesis C-methylase UbiE
VLPMAREAKNCRHPIRRKLQFMPFDIGSRDADKSFYSASVNYYDPDKREGFGSHVETVSRYLDAVVPSLQRHLEGKNSVDIAELGAGTCLTTLMIRKRFPTARFTCLDISLSRMQALIEESAALLGTHHEGIELIEADFSNALPLDDTRFDIVVFDSALHHSRSIWTTLRECKRILRPNGAVAALREQYLATLTSSYVLRRLLRTPEVQAGVAENAYLKAQYAYYFRAAGFDPKFYSVAPRRHWPLFSSLNGIVYSKWSIWAPLAG